MIKAVLFDFGGVIAEEGFFEGVQAIGKQNGLDPQKFFSVVDTLIYETGYLTGAAGEAEFWSVVRNRTGITGDDESLKEEILRRFVIRPDMLSDVDALRTRGVRVALLSDQTNWLDEINKRTPLFQHFDRIFNSYHVHKSKRDASVFMDVCSALGTPPEQTLFIDDNINHVIRAQRQGLRTIHFVTRKDFEMRLREYLYGMTEEQDENVAKGEI
ncbi:MAG TPA: HAD family phosphatase [Nitrospirota bacterium]|nr:HAD family phosphatase [Nitrospirota bacterium]